MILKVNGLTSRGVFEDVSFALKKGEVLGFTDWWALGVRRSCGPCAESTKRMTVKLFLKGRRSKTRTIKKRYRTGLHILRRTANRRGCSLDMTIEENIAAAKVDNIRSGLPSTRQSRELCDRYVGDLEIKIASNQQR